MFLKVDEEDCSKKSLLGPPPKNPSMSASSFKADLLEPMISR